MKLKLKNAIRVGGVQYRAPSVIETKELRISDAEAHVLVLRGAAVVYDEVVQEQEKSAPAPGEPEVVKVDTKDPKSQPKAQAKAKTGQE